MTRITIEEAAKELGISRQLLRILMQKGKLDIGFVIDGKRKTYVIFEEKLKRWTDEHNY